MQTFQKRSHLNPSLYGEDWEVIRSYPQSENLMKHLDTESACVDLVRKVAMYLREEKCFEVVQTLEVGIAVWTDYHSTMQEMSGEMITIPEIQKHYSDLIHSAFAYLDAKHLRVPEIIKTRISEIITP